MGFGRKPLISEAAVQAVLDTLVFSTSYKTELVSLQYLFIVEEKLLDPKIPSSDKERLYIIQLVLIELIIFHLRYIRKRFDRDLDSHEIYKDAIQSLAVDAQAQSSELMSWGVLYYLYVQVDFGFTLDDLALSIGVTARTLRRYRSHGVELLTQKLWEREALCRQEHHLRKIRSQLKPWAVEHFIGRDQEIESVVRNIVDKQRQIHYIHGARGVGKSTFIHAVVTRLMSHISVDELLWINKFKAADISQIRHHFLNNNADISLDAVFSTFKCVLVLEDVDDLLKSSDFDLILNSLQGATIFFSSVIHYTLDTPIERVFINKLDNVASGALIRSMFDHEISNEIVNHILELSGGNPDKIKHFTNYHKYSFLSDKSSLIGGLKLEQRLLLIFIPSKDGLLIDDLNSISLLLNIGLNDIDFLVSLKFLIRSENRVYNEVESELIANSLTKLSARIFDIINRIPSLHEPWVLSTHILTTYYRYIDAEILLKLISKFWRIGLIYGNKVAWHSIILDMPKNNEFWTFLARAVSHKEMNELLLAESILLELLKVSGLDGNFTIQAEASLELVKIYRLANQYQKAIQHVNILNGALKKYLESQQYSAFTLEQAQLALDMNQLEYAITLVTALKLPEALMIRAEALYRLDNYQSCIEICHRLLSEFYLPNTLRGIVHNLIGRCYQSVDHLLAAEEFDLAIEYFTVTFNLRHLSHAQINLATSFIYLEEIEKAKETLGRAEQLCKVTLDHVGMKIIQKNKSYIHHLITSKY